MELFEELLRYLNVPIAVEKNEGPVQVLTFLGLELDSLEMVVRLPKDKINEILEKIRIMLSKEKTTLREMQSLIGSLNFACRAIVPGRPFCRRLINSICGLTKAHHHLRVNQSIKLDLMMWSRFLSTFNGISVFHDRFWVANDDVELYSDSAAGSGMGFGVIFKSQWSCAQWPEKWHSSGITNDITFLELFPIVVALQIWGEKLRNKKIRFHCDNTSVVYILNNMSCKSVLVMKLVRFLTMLCLNFNIVVKSSHIPGINNEICDALSRQQFERFRRLAPKAEVHPCPIPSHLWDICMPEHPDF